MKKITITLTPEQEEIFLARIDKTLGGLAGTAALKSLGMNTHE